jgi:hypothetical protein
VDLKVIEVDPIHHRIVLAVIGYPDVPIIPSCDRAAGGTQPPRPDTVRYRVRRAPPRGGARLYLRSYRKNAATKFTSIATGYNHRPRRSRAG